MSSATGWCNSNSGSNCNGGGIMDEDWKVGTSVTFSVNGKKVKGQLTKRLFRTLTYFLYSFRLFSAVTSVSVGAETSLAEYLRDWLHLSGTKVSCARGGCGACAVNVAYRDTEDEPPTIKSINAVRAF